MIAPRPLRRRARRAAPASRLGQAGMTLIEIMIAIAILSLMMLLAWTTTSNTFDAKRRYEALEDRNREIRNGLGRVVVDLESAYLSQNEDMNATDRRTMFIGKSGGHVPEIRFSSLSHRPLWADAHESDQTLIAYYAMTDKEDPSKTNWIRRESRRLSNKPWKQEPADVDVLIHDVEDVKFQYWSWEDQEWRDQWDSTAAEGQRNRLPTRVRITLTYKNVKGDDVKITTEANLLMQEPLIFITS